MNTIKRIEKFSIELTNEQYAHLSEMMRDDKWEQWFLQRFIPFGTLVTTQNYDNGEFHNIKHYAHVEGPIEVANEFIAQWL